MLLVYLGGLAAAAAPEVCVGNWSLACEHVHQKGLIAADGSGAEENIAGTSISAAYIT